MKSFISTLLKGGKFKASSYEGLISISTSVGACTALVISIISYLAEIILFAQLNLFSLFFCVLIFVVNYFGYSIAARILFLLAIPIISVVYAFILGRAGIEYYLFIGCIGSLYFFKDNKVLRFTTFLISLVAFMISKYLILQSPYNNSDTEFYTQMHQFNIVFSFIILFIVARQIQLQQSIKLNNAKEETKDQSKMLAILSHDLMSPIKQLQVLLSNRNSELFDQKQKEAIVESAAQKLTVLAPSIENVLLWVNRYLQSKEPVKVEVDVYEIIIEVKEMYEENFSRKSINFEIDCSENLKLNADPNILALILRNLISNAYKFSEKGGKVTVKVEDKSNYYAVSVIDSGKGMTEKEQEAIFKHTISKKGTENERGYGIGLYLVQDFVNLIGESIRVESDLGKGTTFTFTLSK